MSSKRKRSGEKPGSDRRNNGEEENSHRVPERGPQTFRTVAGPNWQKPIPIRATLPPPPLPVISSFPASSFFSSSPSSIHAASPAASSQNNQLITPALIASAIERSLRHHGHGKVSPCHLASGFCPPLYFQSNSVLETGSLIVVKGG